jgi:drug/metabolite transporter (DMT)-like permease
VGAGNDAVIGKVSHVSIGIRIDLSLLVERPYLAPLPAWPAMAALLLLTLFSTALPFVIFYRLVEKTSAPNLSLVTYMVPGVATILGIVVLNEQLGGQLLGFFVLSPYNK